MLLISSHFRDEHGDVSSAEGGLALGLNALQSPSCSS